MADEPKIIIDEGWKAQVERERQEATVKPDAQPEAEAGPEDEEELSLFENLVSGMAAQTMMALGLVAPEGQEQVYVDIGLAKHLVDSLMMLREKTKGNLDEREQAMLTDAIGELQRIFAIRVQQAREAALRQSGIDPAAPPKR